jgi:hypothetical protein
MDVIFSALEIVLDLIVDFVLGAFNGIASLLSSFILIPQKLFLIAGYLGDAGAGFYVVAFLAIAVIAIKLIPFI